MSGEFVFLFCFQTLIREVEEKEVSRQQGERDASLCCTSSCFTLIYLFFFFFKLSHILMSCMIITDAIFPTPAAAQKAGLDGTGAPRDV